MLLGWPVDRSWLHRKDNLGQVSLLLWTQGQAEAHKGRCKPGGHRGTLPNPKLPSLSSRSRVPTRSPCCRLCIPETRKEN